MFEFIIIVIIMFISPSIPNIFVFIKAVVKYIDINILNRLDNIYIILIIR